MDAEKFEVETSEELSTIDLSRIRLCRKEIEEMYDQNSKNVSKCMGK